MIISPLLTTDITKLEPTLTCYMITALHSLYYTLTFAALTIPEVFLQPPSLMGITFGTVMLEGITLEAKLFLTFDTLANFLH